jgi:hypothetical protein
MLVWSAVPNICTHYRTSEHYDWSLFKHDLLYTPTDERGLYIMVKRYHVEGLLSLSLSLMTLYWLRHWKRLRQSTPTSLCCLADHKQRNEFEAATSPDQKLHQQYSILIYIVCVWWESWNTIILHKLKIF